MSRFTKKQIKAVEAFERAYQRMMKENLILWADGEGGFVVREKDVKAFLKELDESPSVPFDASHDVYIYIEENNLPYMSVTVG